jgi:hypothetical protein
VAVQYNLPEYQKFYYSDWDSANSTGESVWSSTAVSGNYSYTQFIDSLVFDRLAKVEKQINYYMSKLAKRVDQDILDAMKPVNISLEKPPDQEVVFDPENLWSEPSCLNVKNAQNVGQK